MTITVRIFIISLLLFFLNTGCIAAPQGQMQLFLPPSLSTCMPIQIQWNNAIGPTANISVFTLTNQSTLNVEPARRFSNLDAETGSYLWRIDLPSNQNVIVRLTDSAGRLVDSPPTTIVRSVASEPPCKNNHIVPSLFQQMSCE
ncbi:uncharacterized protein FA14DRAFT_52080 [Meira miltonrushii]|uniref:Uncharacterized protein n=1 Tax=Meira miltonrushii TaxID=1280837 RepID=A0A316VES8_9BASI|nr:uncharacterized protein FA14DRAFT_52080 [Meira miltonrushii]PWN36129.1 hypothetical protein FA14DRAFT_52080 [Meira miltonrushii]